jgi:hypothetical protein
MTYNVSHQLSLVLRYSGIKITYYLALHCLTMVGVGGGGGGSIVAL